MITALVVGGKHAMYNHSMNENPRVLVVEDDPLLSSLLVQRLDTEKFRVMYAPTGEAALDQMKTDIPDLVLLDILLPGKNGFDVLKEIKANPSSKDIPVVVLSNLGQESDIQKAKELGAEKFIVKVTLTLDEVVAMIREVCQGKRG